MDELYENYSKKFNLTIIVYKQKGEVVMERSSQVKYQKTVEGSSGKTIIQTEE